MQSKRDVGGIVIDIDTFAIHDGPGIRMAIYLKGCPLSCLWCHSPESQRAEPELIYFSERCIACGSCVEVCPNSCHTIDDARVGPKENSGVANAIDRSSCVACGACADYCPTRALQIKGEWKTAGEIVDRAVSYEPFFRHTGGGITVSGGEIGVQPDFVCAILDLCRDAGIHTAVETSGFCSKESLGRIASVADLILFDIKIVDDILHKRHTGGSNRGILKNLDTLPSERVVVRIPLIPHITDTKENIRAIAAVAASSGIRRIELLPYNTSAGAKYQWLGRPYLVRGEAQSPGALAELERIASETGVATVVSQ